VVRTGQQQAGAEHRTYRLRGAVVAWWAWVAFAVANLIYIGVGGTGRTALQAAVALAAITGIMFACVLWPKVTTSGDGLTVRNPLRDHWIAWGSVTSVDVAELVRVRWTDGRREKVLYSWALAGRRRRRSALPALRPGGVRARAAGPGREDSGTARGLPPSYGRMPEEARILLQQSTAQLMAAELDGLARQARERGAQPAPRLIRWAWQPLAAIGVPALALVLVIVIR
jgi:hypothetical protein